MAKADKEATDESTYLGAQVDPELHRRVRIEAAKQGLTMADYIRDVLDESTPA